MSLRQMFSLSDRHSWFHTMFWVIVALLAVVPAVLVAALAGADMGVVGVVSQLWTAFVLLGAFGAALVTDNPRIISSDRLVERLARGDEEEF